MRRPGAWPRQRSGWQVPHVAIILELAPGPALTGVFINCDPLPHQRLGLEPWSGERPRYRRVGRNHLISFAVDEPRRGKLALKVRGRGDPAGQGSTADPIRSPPELLSCPARSSPNSGARPPFRLAAIAGVQVALAPARGLNHLTCGPTTPRCRCGI